MGSMIALTESERYWHDMQFESRRRLEQEASDRRRAKWLAFKERIEKELYAARARRRALEVPDSGPGWCRAPGPTSDAELAGFVRQVFDVAFHGIPWPAGWRCAWGEVHLHDPFTAANAACIHPAKILIFDRRRLKGRSERDLLRTALHELTHMVHPDDREDHGATFTTTFDRVCAYYFADEETRRPDVVKGRRFLGPLGWGAPIPGDTWEYRDAR
jgi:hypothetical protein